MNPRLDARERIEHMRLAAQYNPLDVANRIASANLLSDVALKSQKQDWLKAAEIENRILFQTDPTNAEVLEKAILVDLALHNIQEANVYYQQFKRIDRKSPILELVAQAHQKGRTPVAAKP